MVAAESSIDNITTVKLLLEHDADATKVDRANKSCLHHCIGNTGVLAVILQHFSKVNKINIESLTFTIYKVKYSQI